MSDLQSRLEFATKLAHQAGDIMLKNFGNVVREDKADGSPVTIADREVNALVIEEIKKAYPHDGVLGEEASNMKNDAEYVWVCDPIDGTRAFLFGVPTSQFSLALVKDGESILGVIYHPHNQRLYHAIKGEGAFLNNERISVSKDSNLEENFFALPPFQVPLLNSAGLFPAVVEKKIRSCAFLSITFECMLVAIGKITGAAFGYNTAHDIAAVKVIVEEAGGKVTDLFGNEQRYDQTIKGAIISNGLVHDELVKLVKPYLKI